MHRKISIYMSGIILYFLSINSILTAKEGWYSVSDDYEYGHYGVFFIDTQKGFVTTEGGSIMVTNNGGDSWTDLHLSNDNHPSDLFFINKNIGWMACWDTRIYMTEDGGRNWVLMIEDTSGQTTTHMSILYSVHFANVSIGCAVGFRYDIGIGSSSLVIKTIDGGSHWEYQNVTQNEKILFSVFYTDDTTGWICGEQGYFIYTKDGGRHWNQKILGTNGDLTSVFFIDSLHGWVAGSGGIIYRTVDAGQSWIICDNPSYARLLSIHFADSDNGYACGEDGTILKTTNGGASWDKQISGTENGLTNIFAVTADTAYCVGWYGTILKTTNGGVGGPDIVEDNINNPVLIKLEQSYPNPFNPTTTISYQLPKPSFVKLAVYDIGGRLIETLVDEPESAGYHSVVWNGSNAVSGIYIYRIDTGEFSSTKKCLLIK